MKSLSLLVLCLVLFNSVMSRSLKQQNQKGRRLELSLAQKIALGLIVSNINKGKRLSESTVQQRMLLEAARRLIPRDKCGIWPYGPC